MGLKSQLIYQARLAEFPRSALPRDPRAACRWLFQPGLFVGTDLTNPRKGLCERGLERTAPAHLGEELQSRCRRRRRRGEPQGCCCQSTHDYEPVTAPEGGERGELCCLRCLSTPEGLQEGGGRVSTALQRYAQNLLLFQNAKLKHSGYSTKNLPEK